MLGKNVANLRKKVMIEPLLQRKVMINFFLIGAAMVFVNMLSLYLLVSRVIQHVENMNQVSPELYELLIRSFADLSLISFILSLAVIVGFCIYGMYYSNRIAGPIYNLRRAVTRIIEGEKNVEIKFRKGDYFQDLCEQMNIFIKKYYEKTEPK